MSRRIVARVGSYIDKQTGQEKGEYEKVGTIMTKDDGSEFVLLNPSINIAGVLAKQNLAAMKEGKEMRDSVIASVFSSDNRQQGQQAPQAYPRQPQSPQPMQVPPMQQPNPQQGQQAPPQYQQPIDQNTPF